MPITIKEIIASDTISQLVDKTNFNFDQLLLNGGGPSGPIGPQGPIGPVGGRGPKGSTWYDDPSSISATNPNTIIVSPTLLSGDYYLDFNGDVWEYNGTTWIQTNIDLKGATGAQGAGGGFALAYGSPINAENTKYQGPIGFDSNTGIANGANTTNEGVPSIMIGGAVTITDDIDSSIPLTNAYIIPNVIAEQTNSPTVSLFLHQRDTATKGIMFHGGAATPADKFEQLNIGSLSYIKIGTDDRLILGGEKPPTSPSLQLDLVGLELLTNERSQEFNAGKSISLNSGISSVGYGLGNDSNVEIKVGLGSSSGNKFMVTTEGATASAVLEQGTGFPFVDVIPTPPGLAGTFQVKAGPINFVSSALENITAYSGGNITLDTTKVPSSGGGIKLQTLTGNIELITSSNDPNGNIFIKQSTSSANALGNIVIENLSAAPNTSNGGDIYIQGKSQLIVKNAGTTAIAQPSIVIDYGYHQSNDPTKPLKPHTRFVGDQTWAKEGLPSGIQIPNANIHQYNYLDSTLTVGGSIFRQTGDSSLTDVVAGSLYEKWVGGTAVQTNEPMHQITIGQGNEGSPAGYPITTPYEAYDNSLTLKVSDNVANITTKDYVTISKNKIGVAVPLVLKRTNEANSTNNSAPGYPNPINISQKFGWDPRNFDSTPSSSANGNMPTTADLNVPYIEIGVGIGYGNVSSTKTENREDKDYTFHFPTGQYPGQMIRVVMYNQAYRYRVTRGLNQETWKYYGDFTLRFPTMRMQRALGNPYTSWWSTTEPGASRDLELSMSAGDDVLGVGKRVMIDLVWNGAKQAVQRGYPQTGTSDNQSTALIEYGWDITSFSFLGGSWNVNRANTTSGTTFPTTGTQQPVT